MHCYDFCNILNANNLNDIMSAKTVIQALEDS
jgi:hypothetical protein